MSEPTNSYIKSALIEADQKEKDRVNCSGSENGIVILAREYRALKADNEALKAELRAELRSQSQELQRAREIVRRIGEGHNPHRKCLAPTKCCPKNRLCFPCLANDFLAQPAPEKP